MSAEIAEERAAHELVVKDLQHKFAVAETAAVASSAKCAALVADIELLEARVSALQDRLASAQACVCACECARVRVRVRVCPPPHMT